jgi:sugar fermentation stimulation protein
MNLETLIYGTYIRRVNRFVVEVRLLSGEKVLAHLANTGRMRELLVEGRKVYLEFSNKVNRKTQYTLLMIENEHQKKIMLKATYANDMVEVWLKENLLHDFGKILKLQREVSLGNSRFDFLLTTSEGEWIIEVKSVNYFFPDYALFPDAPTERGKKHIKELMALQNEGYKGAIVFVLMGEDRDRLYFNDESDSEFVKLMEEAMIKGINVLAYKTNFNLAYPYYDKKVKEVGGNGSLCFGRC